MPLYLDRSGPDRVVVKIRQTFIAPLLPTAAFVPSVADLPAVAGISSTEPAQPVIYVLNEGPPRPASSNRRGSSAGARILSVDPALPSLDPLPEELPPGPRIIHLSVPVGSQL